VPGGIRGAGVFGSPPFAPRKKILDNEQAGRSAADGPATSDAGIDDCRTPERRGARPIQIAWLAAVYLLYKILGLRVTRNN
jgi:hypothetical protein